jgi:hypothetical protein
MNYDMETRGIMTTPTTTTVSSNDIRRRMIMIFITEAEK